MANTKLEQLEAEYQKKRNDVLAELSTGFVEKLKELKGAYDELPEEAKESVFKTDENKEIIKGLGLSSRKSTGGGKGQGGGAGNRVDAQVRLKINEAKSGITEKDLVKILGDKFPAEKIAATLKAREGKWWTKQGHNYLPKK